jgi:hypothetical protein
MFRIKFSTSPASCRWAADPPNSTSFYTTGLCIAYSTLHPRKARTAPHRACPQLKGITVTGITVTVHYFPSATCLASAAFTAFPVCPKIRSRNASLPTSRPTLSALRSASKAAASAGSHGSASGQMPTSGARQCSAIMANCTVTVIQCGQGEPCGQSRDDDAGEQCKKCTVNVFRTRIYNKGALSPWQKTH